MVDSEFEGFESPPKDLKVGDLVAVPSWKLEFAQELGFGFNCDKQHTVNLEYFLFNKKMGLIKVKKGKPIRTFGESKFVIRKIHASNEHENGWRMIERYDTIK